MFSCRWLGPWKYIKSDLPSIATHSNRAYCHILSCPLEFLNWLSSPLYIKCCPSLHIWWYVSMRSYLYIFTYIRWSAIWIINILNICCHVIVLTLEPKHCYLVTFHTVIVEFSIYSFVSKVNEKASCRGITTQKRQNGASFNKTLLKSFISLKLCEVSPWSHELVPS